MIWKQYSTGALLSLSLMMSVPAPAFAISFGELKVKSQLGEAFEAEIPMTLRPDEIVQGVHVYLGLPADYHILELERALTVTSLTIDMVGNDVHRLIKITSSGPFKEPFFNLLLKSSVGRGSYYRNFPVFLDLVSEPPTQMVTAVNTPVAPSKVPEATPAIKQYWVPEAPVVVMDAAQTYGPVLWDETLTSVARKMKGDDGPWSIAQIAVAIWKKNRDSFTHDNMSGLQLGTTLMVPTADDIGEVSAQSATGEFQRQWTEWQGLSGAAEPESKEKESAVLEDTPLPVPNANPKKVAGKKTADISAEVYPESPEVSMNLTLTPGDSTPAAVAEAEEEEVLPEGIVLSTDDSRISVAAVVKSADSEKFGQMSGKVSQLTGQVDQLTSNISKLSSKLEKSESSRLQLQNRLAKFEAQLARIQAAKREAGSDGWGNSLLYAAASGLVVALVTLLLWMGRAKRKEQELAAAGTPPTSFVGTTDIVEEPTPATIEPGKAESVAVESSGSSKEQEVIAEVDNDVVAEVEESLSTPEELEADVVDSSAPEEVASVAVEEPEESEDLDPSSELQDAEELEIADISAVEVEEPEDLASSSELQDAEELEIADISAVEVEGLEADESEDLATFTLPDITDDSDSLESSSAEVEEFSQDESEDLSPFTLPDAPEQSESIGGSASQDLTSETPLDLAPFALPNADEAGMKTPVQEPDSATDSMEQVEFVSVETENLTPPPVVDSAEPLETLEFTMDNDSAVDEKPEVAPVESVLADDNLVQEVGSTLVEDEELVRPVPVGSVQDDSELILEIGFDLEDSEEPEAKK
jgi:FimV-like protein